MNPNFRCRMFKIEVMTPLTKLKHNISALYVPYQREYGKYVFPLQNVNKLNLHHMRQ